MTSPATKAYNQVIGFTLVALFFTMGIVELGIGLLWINGPIEQLFLSVPFNMALMGVAVIIGYSAGFREAKLKFANKKIIAGEVQSQ